MSRGNRPTDGTLNDEKITLSMTMSSFKHKIIFYVFHISDHCHQSRTSRYPIVSVIIENYRIQDGW